MTTFPAPLTDDERTTLRELLLRVLVVDVMPDVADGTYADTVGDYEDEHCGALHELLDHLVVQQLFPAAHDLQVNDLPRWLPADVIAYGQRVEADRAQQTEAVLGDLRSKLTWARIPVPPWLLAPGIDAPQPGDADTVLQALRRSPHITPGVWFVWSPRGPLAPELAGSAWSYARVALACDQLREQGLLQAVRSGPGTLTGVARSGWDLRLVDEQVADAEKAVHAAREQARVQHLRDLDRGDRTEQQWRLNLASQRRFRRHERRRRKIAARYKLHQAGKPYVGPRLPTWV